MYILDLITVPFLPIDVSHVLPDFYFFILSARYFFLTYLSSAESKILINPFIHT